MKNVWIPDLEVPKEAKKSERRTSVQIFQDGLDWFDTLKSNKTENSIDVRSSLRKSPSYWGLYKSRISWWVEFYEIIFSARKTILLWIMNTIVRPVTTHFWNISKRRMHIQDTDQQTPLAWVRRPEIIWHPVQRMRSKIGCFYFADIHHDSNSKCNSPQDSFLIDDSEYSSNQVNLCRNRSRTATKCSRKVLLLRI